MSFNLDVLCLKDFLTASARMVAIKSVIPLILSVCMSLCLQCLTSNVYIVVSQDGRCPAGGACYNISTFGKMADSFSNTTGLVVHFLEGTHLLDLTKLVVFTNLTNTVFEGEGSIEQGFHETVQQSTVVSHQLYSQLWWYCFS